LDQSNQELEDLRSEQVARCQRALTKIRDLVEARRANVLNMGTKAWGQWLNEPNYMEDQWGRFGSSAGVQVMAATQSLTGTAVRWEDSACCRELAPELFPAEVPEIPDPQDDEPEHREVQPGDDDPYKFRDFAQPLKVAFCVDALYPNEQVVRRDHALVDHLVGQRLHEKACWTTRLEGDPKRSEADLHLVTAFALFALLGTTG
jgi:hypothetical protein